MQVKSLQLQCSSLQNKLIYVSTITSNVKEVVRLACVSNSLCLSWDSDHRRAHIFKNYRKLSNFWSICHIWDFLSTLPISVLQWDALLIFATYLNFSYFEWAPEYKEAYIFKFPMPCYLRLSFVAQTILYVHNTHNGVYTNKKFICVWNLLISSEQCWVFSTRNSRLPHST